MKYRIQELATDHPENGTFQPKIVPANQTTKILQSQTIIIVINHNGYLITDWLSRSHIIKSHENIPEHFIPYN